MSDTDLASPSLIADLTYRGYDGGLQTHALRWWTVALATLRANVNKTRYWYWMPAVLIFLTYLIHTAYFYFDRGIRATVAAANGIPVATDLRGNPFSAELYDTMSYPLVGLLVFVAALVVGSASIAADNRANALLVYLSRPLTRFDYLFGKWAGIFILLAALILAPSLLQFVFFVGSYGGIQFLKDNPTLILRLVAASLVPAAVHSSLILGFSAWTRSTRIAGAIYAAFYLISGILSLSIGNVLWWSDKKGVDLARNSTVMAASVNGVKNALAMDIYDVQPPPAGQQASAGGQRKNRKPRRRRANAPEKSPERPPIWISIVMGGVLITVPLAAAASKIRAVEVVSG